MISKIIELTELGYVPDSLIRLGIRNLCKQRLKDSNAGSFDKVKQQNAQFVEELKSSPIALVPELANEQHYEVPPRFFELVLGNRLKYSCGHWDKSGNLDESEIEMLELSIQRAELEDGMDILELGCGWGSLTLFMAEKFPKSRITAVSNSKDQRKFINAQCELKKINNVEIITSDMNDFEIDKKFDRVVSIEMFEHMRNYQVLLKKISTWLKKNGKLFVHIFTHKSIAYPFEDKGPGDWMAREFFSGGIMPSRDLLLNFQDDLKIEEIWDVSGTHYEKTSLAWLNKMDGVKKEVIKLFEETYGKENAIRWFHRWRIFFMACEELFGYSNGTEWGVTHYRFIR